MSFLKEIIKKHIYTNRAPVTKESNALVQDIADKLNSEVISVNSGSEVLTWVIPEFWSVKKAVLKRLSGEVVIDYKNNPLYLWTNSISFQGIITKNELDNHILTDKERPNIIPYHYRQGFKIKSDNWGFSIPYNEYLNLTDNEYIVDIDVGINNNGSMLTGIDTIGSGKKIYIFAAHTCHPAQAVDGLTNVALLAEIFFELKNKKLNNTYKFVFGPEYYAAAVFLNNLTEKDEKNINGGFFLDIVGAKTNLAFSTSFFKNSYIDRVCRYIFNKRVKDYNEYGYRELIGNDEMFYNGPYYKIPMATLSQEIPDYYHSSDDNYENIDFNKIEEYKKLIFEIIDVLDNDYIPVIKYKGPLYLSRYDLYIDIRDNVNGYMQIEAMQITADGKLSCFEIAEIIGADYYFVKSFFDELLKNNLAEKL